MTANNTTEPISRERVSVVCCHDNQILCFFAVDPTSSRQYYFLPGGGIEPGESELRCGERETLEETGYLVTALPDSKRTAKYHFNWDGKIYLTTTHFYKAVLAQEFVPAGTVSDQDYNKGPRWIPVSEVEKYFDYNLEILEAIRALI